MSIHDIPDEDLRRANVGVTFVCQMDFKNNPQNWWLGYGPLPVGDIDYQGTGDVIKVSSINATYGMSAGMMRFEISNASPEMVARCDDQEAEINNRRCHFFYQLFSTIERDGQHTGQLIGGPISMFVGVMKDMQSSSSADDRTIELEAYGRLSRQAKPPFGRWTDADHRARYPGDTGLGLIASLKEKAIVWLPGS